FALRAGFWPHGSPRQAEFCWTECFGPATRKRCFPAACRSGTGLDRSRSTLREIWPDPGGARPGFPRSRARISRQPADRQGYVNNLVSAVEKDDCAGLSRNQAFATGEQSADGNYHRGRPAESACDGGEAAIL